MTTDAQATPCQVTLAARAVFQETAFFFTVSSTLFQDHFLRNQCLFLQLHTLYFWPQNQGKSPAVFPNLDNTYISPVLLLLLLLLPLLLLLLLLLRVMFCAISPSEHKAQYMKQNKHNFFLKSDKSKQTNQPLTFLHFATGH